MAPITSDLAALAEDRMRASHERAARRRLAQDWAGRRPPRAVGPGVPARVPRLAHLVGRVPVLQGLR